MDCLAQSVAPAAAVSWLLGNSDDVISHVMETKVQADGLVLVHSSVQVSSSLYAGQNLTCMVEHPSLEEPEKRTIHVPVHSMLFLLFIYFILWHIQPHTAAHLLPITPCFLSEAPQLSVSVMRQHASHLWLAVCDCAGEDVRTNLAWILPEGAKGQTTLQSKYEGRAMKARLTYQFPLALHEGQNLTCVYKFEHGTTEKRSVHVPKYCECVEIALLL